jgi:isopentenyldiphosphate isomerase
MISDYSDTEIDLIDVCDANGKYIRTEDRKTVHDLGLWHYAIHCWVYYDYNNTPCIVFQKREHNKRLFPDKYDVAAAGHYVSGERGIEGIRELEEELNIQVENYSITNYGIKKIVSLDEKIKNRELCNIYLCRLLGGVEITSFNSIEIQDVILISIPECIALFNERTDCAVAYSVKSRQYFEVTLDEFIYEYFEYFHEMIEYICHNWTTI